MNTNLNQKDQVFNFINISLLFFALGLTSSPTIVSAYHIFIFVPMIFTMRKIGKIKLTKSSIFLLALAAWGIFVTGIQFSTIVKPFKAFQEMKYYLFAVGLIWPLWYYFKKASPKEVKRILNLLLFTIVVGLFVGIARSKFGFDPVKWKMVPGKYHVRVGGFTNYMRYGYSSALMLVLGVGACFNFERVKDYVSKTWLGIFLTFNTLAIILSETRGALLAVVCGLSFMLIKYRPRIGKSLVGIGVLGVISIGIISTLKMSDHRYLNINDGSNKKRMSQFYSAAMAIKDNPVFGLGADQFSYNVPSIKNKYDIWSKEYAGHSHNIFLEHGANYGVVGLVLFVGFLLFWSVELFKARTNFSWVCLSYLVAFVMGGQVELLFDVINSHLIFFIYAVSQIHLLSDDVFQA